MNENLITVQQLPVIVYERLESVGQEIDKRIAALDLDKQLVTEGTKKAVKDTRAMLNKELDNFEEQRKRIKEQVVAPYEAFEKAYNTFIKVKYEKADGILKVKIDEFDRRLKADKEARIRAYFTELCQANNIDFLPFERLCLNIRLNDSDKSLKDIVNTNIDNVVKSLAMIESLNDPDEYKAEILTDYKQTLDVMTAINNAKYRKQQREAELQRLEVQKARAEQARLAAEARAKEVAPLQAPEEVKSEERIVKNEVVPAVQEVTPDLIVTSFTVQGTMEQLRALKAYILSNNIKIIE
ncbi:hypothetical protein HMPREF1551_00563 [Capnocytophaga sp. oral taxon 863 str. F0517]|uniref:DUF1351 domain-containing protein n=1 Tax=Capnocytophaga sp. oral taxon 863 TaxID=1227265 RepID=UPI0003964E47|nr:DUF1351 domain-containing protein [Capnocytophaga sp. oral taxon 863]ERI64324.1 hypothetical protein HMPREF1551_00563 [Capnocytophaga sp. oral taxon 863 str. F0517]